MTVAVQIEQLHLMDGDKETRLTDKHDINIYSLVFSGESQRWHRAHVVCTTASWEEYPGFDSQAWG